MELDIKIKCGISDPHTEAEMVDILDRILPWMADNVVIESRITE